MDRTIFMGFLIFWGHFASVCFALFMVNWGTSTAGLGERVGFAPPGWHIHRDNARCECYRQKVQRRWVVPGSRLSLSAQISYQFSLILPTKLKLGSLTFIGMWFPRAWKFAYKCSIKRPKSVHRLWAIMRGKKRPFLDSCKINGAINYKSLISRKP